MKIRNLITLMICLMLSQLINTFPLMIGSAKAGGISIGMQAKSSYGYDTNIFRTKENKVGSQTKLVGASGRILAAHGFSSFSSYYNGDYTIVDLSSSENSEYHNINSTLTWKKNKNSIVSLIGSYGINYDPRGSTQSFLDSNLSNAQFSTSTISTKILTPLPFQKLNFLLSNSYGVQRYEEVINQEKNTTSTSLNPEAQYRYSGKTNIVFGYIGVRSERLKSDRKISSYRHRINTGTRWLATGKTNGNILIGYETTMDENGNLGGYSLTTNISVEWMRKSFSKLYVSLNRGSKSFPSKFSNFYVNNALDVTWYHVFTNKFKFDLGSRFSYDQIRGVDGYSKFNSRLRVYYNFSKYIGITASTIFAVYGNPVIDVNHNSQQYSLGINISL